MSTMPDIFGPPIHTYTRSEAIADGVLIEVTQSVVGRFPVPVAYTAAAHAAAIAWDDETDSHKGVFTGQDQTAREADVLWMFICGARANRGGDRFEFQVHRVPPAGRGVLARPVTLVAVLGGDDDGKPVVTIMLAGES